MDDNDSFPIKHLNDWPKKSHEELRTPAVDKQRSADKIEKKSIRTYST